MRAIRYFAVALAATVHSVRPALQWIVTSGRRQFEFGTLPDGAQFLPKPYRAADLIEVATQTLETRG